MWRLVKLRWVVQALCVCLFLGGVGSLIFFSTQPIEQPALTILAPHDIQETVPVYAQFVVTQRLRLPETIQVTHLSVPVYVPVSTRALVIDLRQDGKLIERWRQPEAVPGSEAGSVLVQLSFGAPRSLQGVLELSIAAPTISDATKETAPRLFVEQADDRYPDGNYRIAQNEKQGDIGLEFIEQVPRWYQFRAVWGKRGFYFTAQAGLWLLGSLFLAVLPAVVWRVVEQEQGAG